MTLRKNVVGGRRRVREIAERFEFTDGERARWNSVATILDGILDGILATNEPEGIDVSNRVAAIFTKIRETYADGLYVRIMKSWTLASRTE